MNVPAKARKPIFETKWLWVLVFLFAGGEWLIIFHPDLRSSLSVLRQLPRAFSCVGVLKDTALLFFNFKVWVIVSLSQAIAWGVVAYVALRWLVELWESGQVGGRWRRVATIAVRSSLFAFGLWFFLTPAPEWHLGCLSGRVSVRSSGVLAYVAVGLAVIVMWVLENRACGLLQVHGRRHAITRRYLDLRRKLQTLLSLASLVLAFGVIGLMNRRTFLEPLSPDSFFPGSIVLEGFEYTVLLALAYAPVHAAFNTVGAALRDSLVPVPDSDTLDGIQDWAKHSNELGELLQITVYDWKSFGPGFPILAPFLLSLLSGLAKH